MDTVLKPIVSNDLALELLGFLDGLDVAGPMVFAADQVGDTGFYFRGPFAAVGLRPALECVVGTGFAEVAGGCDCVIFENFAHGG